MEYTKYHDCNGDPIPYGTPLDFIWWANFYGAEVELHYTVKIRKRKRGDIFEFVKDNIGGDCHFTHRLTALNWTEDDLELIKDN